jgi:hypothetical protein
MRSYAATHLVQASALTHFCRLKLTYGHWLRGVMTQEEASRKLDDLLMAFSRDLGTVPLRTEEDGVCLLVFDQRTDVYLLVDHLSGDLLAWSNLGALPQDGAEPVLRNLMQANLFWSATGGGTLGLVAETDSIVLAMRRPVEALGVEGLQALIESLVERAESLAAVLSGESIVAAKAPSSIPLSAVIRG